MCRWLGVRCSFSRRMHSRWAPNRGAWAGWERTAGLSGDRPLASDPAHFTTLSLADSLLSGATLTHSHWALSGPVHSWMAQRPGAAAAGGCVDKHRPPLSLSLSLSLSDNPPKHPENKVNQRGCIQQSNILGPADLLAPSVELSATRRRVSSTRAWMYSTP